MFIICQKCGRSASDKTRNHTQKYCSAKCRTSVNMKTYYEKHRKERNEANKKWRSENKKRNKICILRSMLKSLTKREREKIFKEFSTRKAKDIK